MKTIRQLRQTLRFNPGEINSSVKYFADHVDIDFDVFLPSIGKNLQRDLVWNLHQKRELIWSILMNRNIPRMAIIATHDNIYQVIDGKQRLSTMLSFCRCGFSLEIDSNTYYFSELPEDYQRVISGFMFPYYIVHESQEGEITDQDKIDWFRFINFAGTQQDAEHMNSLTKIINQE